MNKFNNVAEKIFLLVIVVFFNDNCFSQNTLTKLTNMIQTDSIVKYGIEYFDAGDDGEEQLWDFTDVCQSKEKYVVLNKQCNKNTVCSVEPDMTTCYQLQGDSVLLVGNESRLQEIKYESPILSMRYPFTYGDSISKSFLGYGVYCGNHVFKESGAMKLHGDAYGSIILSEKDTIPNVFRVYSLKSYYLAMDMEREALDTAKLKQVIEEHYQWFARGCRYPIFETIASTSYSNLKPLGTSYKAYCYLPEDQLLLNDSVNMEIQKHDLEEKAHQELLNKDIFHYDIQINDNTILVNYQLDENARVTSLVSNSMGIIYKQKKRNGTAGERFTETIDCSGLVRGQYVLYMNVNGKIYSEKVVLK
ncbi:MAG: hypothetical protein E7104_00085 [Prevotella sp.]|jgi:hypothetical protein|nr:hypothetical protein [Prevotella sp.]